MRTLLNKNLEVSKLKHREVIIREFNGNVIDGIVHDVRIVNDSSVITIMVRGDWDKRVKLIYDDIEIIEYSNYPYYSMKHKIELRERHKPMIEFRYTKEELKGLVNKFVSVNYDGKRIEGEIVGVNYIDSNTGGFTVKSIPNEEVKYVKSYRLRELIEMGSSYKEYLGFKVIQNMDSELHKIVTDLYSKGNPEGPEASNEDSRDLLEEYFEIKIDRHNGLKVSLAKFNYDWRDDVSSYKERYEDDGEWTSSSEESYNNDLIKAGECNIFYQMRKELIDDIILKVQEVSWKDYGMSQIEGENKALNYICQSDFIYNKI